MRPSSDVIRRGVGLRIREIRREEGITQEELGRRTGIPASQISRLERGLRSIPVDELVLIAIALDRMSHEFFVDIFRGY